MRYIQLCLLLTLLAPQIPGTAWGDETDSVVVFSDGIIMQDGIIFHSRKELDDYQLISKLEDCTGDRFYAQGQEDTPANIATVLALPGRTDLIFRTCTDRAQNIHYFVRQQMIGVVNHSGRLISGREPSTMVRVSATTVVSPALGGGSVSNTSRLLSTSSYLTGHKLSADRYLRPLLMNPSIPVPRKRSRTFPLAA